VKALLAAALAVSTLAGSVAVAPAADAAVKIVVKPGYPYSWHGAHYKYRYGGRYYNRREYKCVMKFHRKVCKYRYW
jgi:hypothetical protein